MADGKAEPEPALVERWLQDQQQWQRTILAYLDSMIKNDDFLVHIGNAMRGSLLAGKPYPTAPAPGGPPAPDAPPDNRLDQVLFAINQLQGQLQDVLMTLEELRDGRERRPPVAAPAASRSPKPTGAKRTPTVVPRAKTRKRRVLG